jgi:hypothetical protein
MNNEKDMEGNVHDLFEGIILDSFDKTEEDHKNSFRVASL